MRYTRPHENLTNTETNAVARKLSIPYYICEGQDANLGKRRNGLATAALVTENLQAFSRYDFIYKSCRPCNLFLGTKPFELRSGHKTTHTHDLRS